jgi:hypothetical protein
LDADRWASFATAAKQPNRKPEFALTITGSSTARPHFPNIAIAFQSVT